MTRGNEKAASARERRRLSQHTLCYKGKDNDMQVTEQPVRPMGVEESEVERLILAMQRTIDAAATPTKLAAVRARLRMVVGV